MPKKRAMKNAKEIDILILDFFKFKNLRKYKLVKFIFSNLKMFFLIHLHLWEKNCVLFICAKVMFFELMWKVDTLLSRKSLHDLV